MSEEINQQTETTSNQEASAPAPETSAAQPTGGAIESSGQEAQAAQWTPTLKYKFNGVEKDFDPMFKDIVKDAETEKKITLPEISTPVVHEKISEENYFVIGGAFRSEENANRFSATLKAEGFSNALVVDPDAKLKMVCFDSFETLEEARKKHGKDYAS